MSEKKKLTKRDYGLLVSLIEREKKKNHKNSKKAGNKVGNSEKKKNHRHQKYSSYLKRVRAVVTEHVKYDKLPVGTRKRIRRSYITDEDVKRMKKLGIPASSIDRMFPSVHGKRRYRSDKVYKARAKGKRVEETIEKAVKTNKRASSSAKTRKTVMESKLPTKEKEKLLTDLERKARDEYKKGYEHGIKHGKREYNRSLSKSDKDLADQINSLFA